MIFHQEVNPEHELHVTVLLDLVRIFVLPACSEIEPHSYFESARRSGAVGLVEER